MKRQKLPPVILLFTFNTAYTASLQFVFFIIQDHNACVWNYVKKKTLSFQSNILLIKFLSDDDDFVNIKHENFTKTSRMSDSNRFSEHSRQASSTSNREFTTGSASRNQNGGKRKPSNAFPGRSDSPFSAPKRPRSDGASSFPSTAASSPPKDHTIEKPLELSLEELSVGCTKKLKIKRTINDGVGSSRIEEKLIEIAVKPGWKAGTRITFPEEGDKNPGRTAADITFVVKDKPHSLFSRDSDNNLLHKANISLKNALLGLSYCIQGLNGNRHTINIKDIIHPGFVQRCAGKGLPLPKTPERYGDLIVTFDIQFPKSLSWDQRRILTECLPS